MNNDKWKIVIFLAVAGLAAYFFVRQSRHPDLMKAPEKITQEPLTDIKKIKTLDEIPCLKFDVDLVQHVHPILKIFVNGKPEIIPANIGLSDDCEKVIHTHDTSGKIHLESQDRIKYTLQDFFTVWGKPLERRGYQLEATVNDQPFDATKSNIGDLVLKTKQDIALRYRR